MNKTITKVFLSLSMCLCYTAGNVSNIHAASLNTSGVKTEYEMLELQRNKVIQEVLIFYQMEILNRVQRNGLLRMMQSSLMKKMAMKTKVLLIHSIME